MNYRKLEFYYWKFFNIIVRFIGFLFCLIGCIISFWGLLLILNPKATININGIDDADIIFKLIIAIAPLVVALLGFLIMRAAPYFPKHIKEWVQKESQKG